MMPYPKQILSVEQQLKAYKDAELEIKSDEDTKAALRKIGYYRLRGYSMYFYDTTSKTYQEGTSFDDIMALYQFDVLLSQLLFKMTTGIEVALRARLSDAMLIYQDALVWTDPSVFSDKKLFWQNHATISSEIARSSDVFIRHHYKQYDGEIPVWAAVEVMSFGTLSKTIKNLKTGNGTAYAKLADNYCYRTQKGKPIKPSMKMLSSWIHSVATLRNVCAHNSRIYGRTFSTLPEILNADKSQTGSTEKGLYQIVLAMKYLRPDDFVWNDFACDLQQLLTTYSGVIDLAHISFPTDWIDHLVIKDELSDT